jgi:Double-GTPase 1
VTVEESDKSILLIGESDVGKTHYGAQLLKRLMKGDGALRMNGAASNLEPFEAAMECLNEGMAAEHTAMATYVESIWPIADRNGKKAELIWPDYGGEQVKNMSASRRVPSAWRQRVVRTPAWVLLIRLQKTRLSDDVFSRPLANLAGIRNETKDVQISDQARMIELLQMLMYAGGISNDRPVRNPRLTVLLTCWDEIPTRKEALQHEAPQELLRRQLPMFSDFLTSNWAQPDILGLSALEKPLSPRDRDAGYAARGPERFGYVILPDGRRSSDLTLPIQMLLAD